MTLDEAEVGIEHHFVGGLYAKEVRIPAGIKLVGHKHTFDHLSALMQGCVVLEVDGRRTLHDAPLLITIAAGRVHEVTAITDVVWACLHATNETNPDSIDGTLIE